MADYRWKTDDQSKGVIRYSDGAGIPNSQGNGDWVKYMEYSAAGGLTDPWQTEAEADNAAYEEEIAWAANSLIDCDSILVFDKTQDSIGNTKLTNQKRSGVTQFANDLDTYILDVQAAGVGGVFPPRPEYEDGEELPTTQQIFYP